jgi:zinc metalloprotease ZmpB
MNQEFDLARNVYIDRDTRGIARQLSHTHSPVYIDAGTPQLVAASYLNSFGALFGLTSEQLKNLSLSPSSVIENASVEYRFLEEKHQFDTSTIAYFQTDLGIPVWEAGIAVQIKLNPYRVLSSQSTLHPDLQVEAPDKTKIEKAKGMSEKEFGTLLGLQKMAKRNSPIDASSLKIGRRGLVIYRYETDKRVPPQAKEVPHIGVKAEATPVVTSDLPTIALPPVGKNIREGQHYVCARLDFELTMQPYGKLHWVALVEVDSLSVLYLRAFVDHVSGMVFDIDPVTTNGGPLPIANNAALNPVRVSESLAGLQSPVAGTQSLVGDNVVISDVELPTVPPPTEPGGSDFNFDARTNNFAAVNAYYHSDKFFRLLAGMGFTRTGYFSDTTFPTPVDHRGFGGSGNVINAHCLGNSGGVGILQTAFALADVSDTTNPLGIACDYRVALHELAGHGVLYNHVHSPNLRFSHSAGDGVAAILNDPGSHAADRFQTFPWLYNVINRRHDRTAAGGWGYGGSIALNPFNGTLDPGGYNNEQILSSAHFRLYQSIGGDSPDLATKQFAARMTVYLIMRAIATLSEVINPPHADGWVNALMTADHGDWVSENLTGGAYSKVIRWAFEKQGLFQPAGTPTPNNNIGAPPAVDVYIDDGRAGEYQYQPVFWNCQNIWNRLHADGGTAHETPVTNQINYAYVKIKNRGSQNATGVVVKAYHANPAAGLSYPIDWTPMNTPQLSAADVPANNAGEIMVGPFQWVPTHIGHECIFMIVSASGDTSNVDQIAAGDSIPEWRLVPNDNNIGQRNVYPVAGSGTSGLVKDFNRYAFELKNPHLNTAAMEARVILPSFLEKRGWKVQFANRGGGSFPLAAGESRNVQIRLIPGQDFRGDDVNASPDNVIQIFGYAGGILVGGMSYQVDPKQKAPEDRGGKNPGKCVEIGGDLLECADLRREQVRRVRVRKVNIDLEIDDGCDC